MSTVVTAGLLLLPILLANAQQLPPTLPSSPFIDPANDPRNPLRYIASDVLTGISVALYLIVGLILSFWTWKRGAKFMLSMVIGTFSFALGLALRFGLARDPRGKGLYIAEYLFVVLSPCAFIAADYVLLGRLAAYLRADKHLIIRPDRVTKVFLTSDIVTFLIQATGGALATSAEAVERARIGSKIFLAGLALQMASFALFSLMYAIFLYKLHRHSPAIWNAHAQRPWYDDWRALGGALALSCIGITVRSVYRTVELSEGFGGRLGRTESYFYACDTYPLFVAVAVFVFFWPGRFFTGQADDSIELEEKRNTIDESASA